MIVVDASLIVQALATNAAQSATSRRLAEYDDLYAPAHLDAEVGHALRGLVRGSVLGVEDALAALDELEAIPIERIPLTGLVHRAFDLRANMSFYDALYVALAESLDQATLLTADSKFLRTPGIQCEIEVVASGR